MAVVLTGLHFSLSASAQNSWTCNDPITTEKVCVTLPIQKTSFTKFIDIPKFNSELGSLQSVKLFSVARGFVWTEVDNEDTEPITWDVIAVGAVRTTLPLDLGEIFAEFGTGEDGIPLFTEADDPDVVPPGDFNPDYAGSDYARINYGTLADPEESETEYFIIETETEMLPFIGSAGETLGISVKSESKSGAVGRAITEGFKAFP